MSTHGLIFTGLIELPVIINPQPDSARRFSGEPLEVVSPIWFLM